MPARIVVGVDDSAKAADTLALGAALAGLIDADLVVVNVRAPIPLRQLPASEVLERDVRAASERILDGARAALPKRATADFRSIAEWSPADGLQAVAEEEGARAIVVAQTHRHSRRAAGVAEHLLHGAPCAVAVAPPESAGEPAGRPQAIGVAFDGSSEATSALLQALALAHAADARLRVVGVVDDTWLGPAYGDLHRGLLDDQRQELRERLDAALAHPEGLKVEVTLPEGDVAETLASASKEVDLLVCGSRGRGPLGAILTASVSNRLAHTAEGPLLVLPRGAAPFAPLPATAGQA